MSKKLHVIDPSTVARKKLEGEFIHLLGTLYFQYQAYCKAKDKLFKSDYSDEQKNFAASLLIQQAACIANILKPYLPYFCLRNEELYATVEQIDALNKFATDHGLLNVEQIKYKPGVEGDLKKENNH